MQHIRNSILRHVRVNPTWKRLILDDGDAFRRSLRFMCASTSNNYENLTEKVVALVKKFDRIDPALVTETANFQKDLSLDSLDRVELVMAFEQEFSIEIPDEVADKLTCCVDVAKYISSEADKSKNVAKS
ncbi:hypothetical protein GIB67_000988 [Kingdonia uniflora]|uniref:Acyl carrier protein n=1 Tax=Kingdonia uniflora TaxID=39325 RepID=A0A7J7MFS2_9MAGN|nr:hypothetical protein GIB67_000988 [Kingdonia uniflora]